MGIILGVALVGLAFSGFLSWQELFATQAARSCPGVGAPGTVLGYPACVYGFFIYLAIVVVAAIGLRKGRRAQIVGAQLPQPT